jgi:hypothetical protein
MSSLDAAMFEKHYAANQVAKESSDIIMDIIKEYCISLGLGPNEAEFSTTPYTLHLVSNTTPPVRSTEEFPAWRFKTKRGKVVIWAEGWYFTTEHDGVDWQATQTIAPLIARMTGYKFMIPGGKTYYP